MASFVDLLLQFPYFGLTIFFFYWSPPLASIVYRIRFASAGPRKDIYEWTTAMVQFLGVRIRHQGKQTLYKKERCVYLCNHRSWADFFVDLHLTQGLAAPMSRTMVFFAFPVFMSICIVLKGVLLFKRGTIADKTKFNKWLDDSLGNSPVSCLLVYPEGHRSTKAKSLPLKRGMLYYAHSRGLPVQIIHTAGKEAVLSEKRMRASYGQTLVTGFSQPIQSKDFKDFEAFSAEVQRSWDALWTEVYSANPSALPPLVQEDVPTADYPPSMRTGMLLVSLAAIALFLAFVALLAYITGPVMSLFPAPLRVPLILFKLSWHAASFLYCRAKDTPGKVKAA